MSTVAEDKFCGEIIPLFKYTFFPKQIEETNNFQFIFITNNSLLDLELLSLKVFKMFQNVPELI